MPKSPLSAGIAEWVSSEKKAPQGMSRVQFLAHASDIQALLDEGYTQYTVWKYLRKIGLFTYSYESFRKLCLAQIKRQHPQQTLPTSEASAKQRPEPAVVTQHKPPSKTASTSYPASARFRLNPLHQEDVLALAEDEDSGTAQADNTHKK